MSPLPYFGFFLRFSSAVFAVLVCGLPALSAALPSGWSNADIGTVSVAGTASFTSGTGTYTLQGSGAADIAGTTDNFHFAYRALSGDGYIIARIASLTNTNTWSKAGLMIRETIDADSKHALMMVTPAMGTGIKYRTATGGATTQVLVTGAAPRWLKLERRGKMITGFESTDGVTWNVVQRVALSMNTDVLVGLVVCSRTSTLATMTADQVVIDSPDASIALPWPWTEQTVGSPTDSGVALYDGSYVLSNLGADITGTADKMKYVSQTLMGDGVITVKVSSVTSGDNSTRLGLVMRESLDANARSVVLALSTAKSVAFMSRRTVAGALTTRATAVTVAVPAWLRLQRAGNVFTAWRSTDGITWTEHGTETLELGPILNVGLAYSNRHISTWAIGVGDELKLTSPADTDGNGLDDGWEVQYFGGIGVNPQGDPDSDGLTNGQEWELGNDPQVFNLEGQRPLLELISGDDQIAATGSLLSQPLVVRVKDSLSGDPLANIPVFFHVGLGNGRLGSVAPGASALSLFSDVNGLVQSSFMLPATAGLNRVNVSVGGRQQAGVITFDLKALAGVDPLLFDVADIGVPTLPGQIAYSAGTYTMTGATVVDNSGTADRSTFAWRDFTGDGYILARVQFTQADNALAQAGVMMRENLNPEAPNVAMLLTATSGVAFQYRDTAGATTGVARLAGVTGPVWVLLRRSGDVFTGFYSVDGEVWTYRGTRTIALGSTLKVGFTHGTRTSVGNSASFDGLRMGALATAPWFVADIGLPRATTINDFTADSVFVRAGGADMAGAADNFHYIYQPLIGDGRLIARVASHLSLNSSTKSALMVRESLDAGSRHVSLSFAAPSGITLRKRDLTNGTTTSATGVASVTAPYWLRVDRLGPKIITYASSDGQNWSTTGTAAFDPGSTPLIGLAASSSTSSLHTQALFDHISLEMAAGSLGWNGAYYTGADFKNSRMFRRDLELDFSWPFSQSPAPGISAGSAYSVRWQGDLVPSYSETYTFTTLSQGAVRVIVNGQSVIDRLTPHMLATTTGTIALTANEPVRVVVEYANTPTQDARIRLNWSSSSQSDEPVPFLAVRSLDADDDGMPDAWESAHGLNPNNTADAALDPDGDGLSNLQEYELGGNHAVVDDRLPGAVTVETWTGITGRAVADLTRNAKFFTAPDTKNAVTLLETSQNRAENYGARIRGYIVAPATGAYEFWISADDSADFFLSPDDSPFTRKRLARVSLGVSAYRTYTTRPEQHSQSVNLVAGQYYYFEVLHKEGTTADHLSVAWTRPGGTAPELIDGAYLATFAGNSADLDGDGLPDTWAATHGLNNLSLDPSARGAQGDADGDQLTNLEEYQNGLDPQTADSDGDGIADGWELSHGLDPHVDDAYLDLDQDGYPNRFEYANGSDSANPLSVPSVGKRVNLTDPTAYTTIQAAIDAAAPYQVIEIAAGVYTGVGNRSLTVGSKPLIIQGAGTIGATIDLENDGTGLATTADLILKKITFDRPSGFAVQQHGGFGFLKDIKVTRATDFGGALIDLESARMIVTGLEIARGAASGIEATNTHLVVTNYTFQSNDSGSGGAAVHLLGGSEGAFSGPRFVDNHSSVALVKQEGSGTTSTWTNAVMLRNESSAGHVWDNTDTVSTVSYSTFADNRAPDSPQAFVQGSGGSFTVLNSIVYNPALADEFSGASSYVLSHIITSSAESGTDVLNVDPRLTGSGRLRAGSPAIDAGLAGVNLPKDIDQENRPSNGVPDIGADEWIPSEAYPLLPAWFVTAYNVTDFLSDRDSDSLVDYFEYLAGTNPTLADSDGDGVPDKFSGPPLVYAGEDMAVQSRMTIQLSGAVYDDGLPNPPAHLLVAWEVFDEDGYPVDDSFVEFADLANPRSEVRFIEPGKYTLRLVASENAGVTYIQDEITVEVSGIESAYGDLVGHWRFEEGGGKQVADGSSNGNTATLSGETEWTDGVAGLGVSFGPGHGEAEVRSPVGLNIEGEITLAAWVKLAGPLTNRYQRIVSSKTAWNALAGYELEYNPVEKRLTFCGYGTEQMIAYEVDLTSGWHHVAFVLKRDASRFAYEGAFYVDGQLLEDYPFTRPGTPAVVRRISVFEYFSLGAVKLSPKLRQIRAAGGNFAIGAHPGPATVAEDFAGVLDDVRVYRTALAPEAVQEIYTDRNGLKFWVKAANAQLAPGTSTVTSLPDLSGRGNNLVPASAEARPVLESVSGQPSLVVFDGVDDALSAILADSISGSATYFIVAKNLAGAPVEDSGIFATAVGSSLASFELGVDALHTLGVNTYDSRRYPIGYADSSLHLYTVVVDAGDVGASEPAKLTIYRDQRLVSQNEKEATEAQLLTSIVLGRGRGTATFARSGVAEVQVYERALDGLEQKRIENRLMREYVEPSTRWVELTSPRQDVTLTKTSGHTLNVPLRARTTENGRSLARVDFYADGTLVGSASAFPYEYVWTNPSVGVHEIVAVAVEAATFLKSDSLSKRISVVSGTGYQILRLSEGESAMDISDMATLGSPVYIAGYGANRPLIWKSGATAPVSLQLQSGMNQGQAVSVNASGVAVGSVISGGIQKAALWTVNGNLSLIAFPSSYASRVSYATHIADTGYVAGTFDSGTQGLNPFRYHVGTNVTKIDWQNSASTDFANYVSNEGALAGGIGWQRPPVPPNWYFIGTAPQDPVVTAQTSFSSGSAVVNQGPPSYPRFTLSPPFPVNTYVQAFQAFLPSYFSSFVNAMTGSTWVGQSGYIVQLGSATYLNNGQNYGAWYTSTTKQAHLRTGGGAWSRLTPPTLGGLQSEALDVAQVDGAGLVIVGWAHTAKGAMDFSWIPNYVDPGYKYATEETHAFIRTGSGSMLDLNTVIFGADSSKTGWELVRANAVNNQGWIVGEGYYDGRYAAYVTAISADEDADGLSDLHESFLYGSSGASANSDADALSDLQEVLAGSNPRLTDSDSDGLPDDWEFTHDLNPGKGTGFDGASGDPDQDGLTNLQEYQLGTDPSKADTDSDGMPDGWEVAHGLDPLNPADAELDTDSDGLINRLEWQFNSNPTKADGDVPATGQSIPHPVTTIVNTGDGLTDVEEVLLGLNPLAYDTQFGSNARTGLNYWQQHNDPGIDTDGDGLSDFAEIIWGTNPALVDTDGDGMPDGWEVAYGFKPLDPADAALDKDNDKLTNLREYELGLLPNDFDSDNDRLGDGWEIAQGFNPATLRGGLQAWWRFDTTVAGGVFADSAGILHDGLLRGASTIQSGGRLGSALRLDGLNAYAVVKHHEDLNLSADGTFSLWFRPEVGSLATTRQLFDKLGSYTLEIQPGGNLLFTWLIEGEAHAATSTAPLVESQWNHIVLTIDRDSGEIRFHLNGIAAGVITADLDEPFDSSPWPLILGSQRVLPFARTPKGLLDDVRLYGRVLTSDEITEIANPATPSLDPNRDDDGDGLINAEEAAAGTGPLVVDTDGDGLSDYDEIKVHYTNPLVTDTDGDTLSDYAEIHTHGTNPRTQDTDGDGLGDLREVTVWHTSSALTTTHNVVDSREPVPTPPPSRPDGWDTDNDGMPDGWEVRYGLNPLDPADAALDPDDDGMSNLVEYQKDKHPLYPDDISVIGDRDEDGLSDWDEIYRYFTDPDSAETTLGLNDFFAANYGLLPGMSPTLPIGTVAGDLSNDRTLASHAQDGTSPLDSSGKSDVAMDAQKIKIVPIKEIEHDEDEPDPFEIVGKVVTLKSPGCGQKVILTTNPSFVSSLITAIDGLVITDPSGRVKEEAVEGFSKSSAKPDVRPDKPPYLGEDAEGAYLPGNDYDITKFIQSLTPDTSGYIRFQIKAKVKYVPKRKPKPPEEPQEPEEPEEPEEPGPGGPGGGSGGGGFGGWGGLFGFGSYNRPGSGYSNTTPGLQSDPDPIKPTYATSRIMAFVQDDECAPCRNSESGGGSHKTASMSPPGSGSGANNSGVNITFNLSPSGSAAAEGSLRLRGDNLASLASPTALAAISGYSKDTQFVMESGAVRQAVSASRVIDVQSLSGGRTGYELRFYEASAITGTTETNLRTLASVDPIATWTVETLAPAGGYDILKITHVENGRTRVYEYQRGNTPSTESNWDFIEGDGLRITSVVESPATDDDIYRTITLRDSVYGVASVTRQRFRDFVWGRELVEETLDPAGAQPLTTNYAYLTTGAAAGNLETTTSPDGTVTQRQFTTDTQPNGYVIARETGSVTTYVGGRQRIVTHMTIPDLAGDADTQPEFAVLAEEKDGSVYRRSWSVTSSGLVAIGEASFRETRSITGFASSSAWDDPRNEVTISRSATPAAGGSLSLTLSSDGLLSRTAVGVADEQGNITTISERGVADVAGTGFATAPTTRTTEVADAHGHFISRVTLDVASGHVTDSEEILDSDSEERPTEIAYFDGSIETRTYSPCCGLLETSTRNGVTTSYGYDDIGRQISVTQSGITTLTTYDAAGRVRKTTRQPDGMPGSAIITSQANYDPAGRVTTTRDAMNRLTAHEETVSASTGITTTTTQLPYDAAWGEADRPVQISVTDASGRTISQSGNAARPVRYEYGISTLSDADQWGYVTGDLFAYTRTIALDSAGEDTPEVVTTYVSPAGRTLKVLYADGAVARNFYDSVGRLVRQVDPDGVQTLREQSVLGDVSVTAIDMVRTTPAVIDYAVDRITRTTTAFATRESTPVRRTTTEVWETTGVETPTTVSINESSLDGLQNWQTSRGQTTHSQTVIATDGTRTVTTTLPDGSSQIQLASAAGRLTSTIRKDSAGVVLSEVTYGYDAHGRPETQTQTGVGTTTTTYYDDDQVHTVTAPDPDTTRSGAGYDSQTSTYTYDAAGRVSDITLPDATHTYTSYYPTGQTKRTWGSLTYPQEYTYDSQGRVKTLTTWQDFAGDTGKAVTTWNYDAQRGWLESKLHDDGKGPDYTYTSAGRRETRTWARTTSGGQDIVTTYGNDNAGRLLTISYSDGTPNVMHTYDRLGRYDTTTDAAGTLTRSYSNGYLEDEVYTGTGLLTGLQIDRTFETSALHRPWKLGATSMTEIVYAYDDAGRLGSVSQAGMSASIGYSLNTQLHQSTSITNNSVQRSYQHKIIDNLGRIASVALRSSYSGSVLDSRAYTYNALNQRIRSELVNGRRWAYGYDSLGQIEFAEKRMSDDTTVQAGYSFSYDYDDIGNRSVVTVNGRSADYFADSLNRYIERDVPGVLDIHYGEKYKGYSVSAQRATLIDPVTGNMSVMGSNVIYDEPIHTPAVGAYYTHALDNAGLPWRATITLKGRSGQAPDLSYDEFLPTVVESYTYDDDGNLLTDGRWGYSWDAENRLVAMESVEPYLPRTRLEFSYDWQGRRISKCVKTWNASLSTWNEAKDIRFLYDGWNLIGEYSAGSSTLALISTYVWGLDISGSTQGAGGVGGLLWAGISSGSYAPSYDANGNVLNWMDLYNGVIVAERDYGPFGESVLVSGALVNLPWGFSTKYQDVESGFLYYGLRYYNPSTGRWLGRDPIGEVGGLNMYKFVGNNAVCFADYLGLLETNITYEQARTLSDSASIINTHVNEIIKDEFANGWKKEWGGKLVVERIMEALVGGEINNIKMVADLMTKFPDHFLKGRAAGSKYDNAIKRPGGANTRDMLSSMFASRPLVWATNEEADAIVLAAGMNITDKANIVHAIGTDKLDHMFMDGYFYFKQGYAEAVARTHSEGLERGMYGFRASGVYSGADVNANLIGFKFYRDVYAAYCAKHEYVMDIASWDLGSLDENKVHNDYIPDVKARVLANENRYAK
ncbi:LamG-like jellyroll fold domain-containing protein [Rariglobus hedericola]|nr:LamG-like jellyroll fold domain-containing protein [Rariglobus hedericola]